MAEAYKPNQWMQHIQDALNYPGDVYLGPITEGYNTAGRHVLLLLQDAFLTYGRHSFGTATFLAITAIEETAKAELMIYRANAANGERKRGGDPLRNHAKKHDLTIRETTFMSDRILKALGRKRCSVLWDEAQSGAFGRLRESALYSHFTPNRVVTPESAISKERARELLLLAIEAADDILVGYTDASFEWREQLAPMFQAIAVD